MKITILGSGSFITDLKHFGPSYLIEVNEKKILVDAGQGCVIHLLELGIKPQDLDYIFITHFHADHTMDLIAILIELKIAKRGGTADANKKIKIYGQEGIGDFVTNLYNIYNHSIDNDCEITVLKERTTISGMAVTPFKVVHSDLDAIALRFENKNNTVVFSGDTSYCDGIIEACNQANLVILDAANPRGLENEFHLNPDQIAKICTKSKVKKVILSHLTTRVFNENVLSQVSENYSGEVELAEDFKIINISAN